MGIVSSLERPRAGMIYRVEDVTVNDRDRISVQITDEPLTVVDALELAEMLTLTAKAAEKRNLARCVNA